jgi:competence protein ComEC
MNCPGKICVPVTVLLLALAAIAWWSIAGLPDGKLRIWFLDVGQGDAILARLPAGEWMLTDGGPDAGILDDLGRIIPFQERELELVILTHPHADHLDGLLEVFRHYRVKNLLLTGVNYDYDGYARLLETAGQQQVKLWYPQPGRDFRIGRTGIDVIYPDQPLTGRSLENVNNSSLVYRLVTGKNVLFFSGDLETEKETELLETAGLRLSAQVLKAGHHGSKTSNSPSFLQRIKPNVTIISCGIGNKFFHPFAGTLKNFLAENSRIFRTDLDGTIEVIIGGQDRDYVAYGK